VLLKITPTKPEEVIMGFFDRFKSSLENETEKIKTHKEYSTYKTVTEREQEQYEKLNSHSDGILLNRIRSVSVSVSDKKMIALILEKRGYTQNKNGGYDRI